MRLNKFMLGDMVELYTMRCGIPHLSPDEVSGVNSSKEFFEPSRQVGNETSNYQIVPPGYFACNLMHVGRDKILPIALNHSGCNKYVSPAYTIFHIKKDVGLLTEYFFMMLKSDERDRYFWFHTDSSVRDGMSWEDFCNLEIELPNIEIQQKYVDIYKSMVANQHAYESGLDDLKLLCDAYIEDLRKKMPCKEIRPYIEECNGRNVELNINNLQGVNSGSQFGETKADSKGLDYHNYKIVRKNQFAYNPSRINLGSIALLRGEDCIVSPMYVVFMVKDENILLPEYLMMWFGRKEFQRSTLYYASGSVRDTFGFDVMRDVKIPIPDISMQQKIIELYNVYILRKDINDKLKAQIKDICPILIKGSLEEAQL